MASPRASPRRSRHTACSSTRCAWASSTGSLTRNRCRSTFPDPTARRRPRSSAPRSAGAPGWPTQRSLRGSGATPCGIGTKRRSLARSRSIATWRRSTSPPSTTRSSALTFTSAWITWRRCGSNTTPTTGPRWWRSATSCCMPRDGLSETRCRSSRCSTAGLRCRACSTRRSRRDRRVARGSGRGRAPGR